MNQRTVVLLAGLAASASLAWAGDEPEKYEIAWKEKWKVGQVVTVAVHMDVETVRTLDGKPMKAEKSTKDAAYVVRCDAIDDKGACTKRTVFIKSWKSTENDRTDDSISGLHITFSGDTWKLPEGKVAGRLAKELLDGMFKKNDQDMMSKLTLPTRMTVGELWKPDAKEMAAAVPESKDAPLIIDLEAVKMELKLASVEGTPPEASGRLVFSAHLPVKGLPPGVPEGSVMSSGAGADISVERSGPLTANTMHGTERMTMNMTCEIEIPQGEEKFRLVATTKASSEKKTVAGGEIPALPAADVKEPPAGK